MTATRTAGLPPRFAEGDPMRVIGLAERYDEARMAGISEQWERLQQMLGEGRGVPTRRSSVFSTGYAKARSSSNT